MPIPIHSTPNPNAHKYVLPTTRFSVPLNASTADEAAVHSLAARLFALDGVYNVFLAQGFVTVNKVAEAEWGGVDEKVVAIIEEFLEGR